MLSTFYQKIQIIMTLLGLYDGNCDGVWGPKCIEAKRKWELLDEFEPGVPSNGLPFNGRGKLPKGMQYAYKGLDIIWDKWDQEKADAILKEKGILLTQAHIAEHVLGASEQAAARANPEPVATVNSVQPAPLASSMLNTNVPQQPVEKPAESEPVIDEEDEDEDEDEAETETVDDKPQQNQNQPRNPNWTKHRK